MTSVGAWHVHLEATDDARAPTPVNGYHVIPNEAIEAYVAQHPERA